jgi:hypothetical protein
MSTAAHKEALNIVYEELAKGDVPDADGLADRVVTELLKTHTISRRTPRAHRAVRPLPADMVQAMRASAADGYRPDAVARYGVPALGIAPQEVD